MDLFVQLFWGNSVAQPIVVLSLTIVLGLALGRISILGVKFGVGGVLFSGLLLANFGLQVESELLHFAREFGLILFVFTIGMQVGPGFFDSLRRRGLFLNLAALAIVLLGLATVVVCFFLFDLPLPMAVGLLCGAVTNTPSLAAASEVFSEVFPGNAAAYVTDAGIGYAMAYPCGILGILLVMILVRIVFRISPAAELEELKRLDALQNPPLQAQTYVVANPNLFGLKLKEIFAHQSEGIVISRVKEPDDAIFHAVEPDTVLVKDMLIHAVGEQEHLHQFQLLVGPPTDPHTVEERGPLEIRRVLVTKGAVAGKSLRALGLTPEHGVTVTRIIRAGVEFSAGPGIRLHYGDKLVTVGGSDALDKAGAVVGNSVQALNHPHVMPIFLGILFGVICGSIPLTVPGLPAGLKLGLAGGPLLAAIVLSKINHLGGLIWYLPLGANLILREIGIALFLACVGLGAGAGFFQTLISPSGIGMVGVGAIITVVPLLLVALAARIWFKYDYATICGLLAGSMTDPPALAFCVQMLRSDSPSSVYATVYPFTMILRIFTAQILVLGLYYFS